MSNTLFGIVLPHQIQWKEKNQARLHASARHTLTGGLVLSARSGFQPVTLVAEQGTCWVEQAAADALRAHALEHPTDTGLLVWQGVSYAAAWRHDEQDGAVSLSPLWPFAPVLIGELRLYVNS